MWTDVWCISRVSSWEDGVVVAVAALDHPWEQSYLSKLYQHHFASLFSLTCFVDPCFCVHVAFHYYLVDLN